MAKADPVYPDETSPPINASKLKIFQWNGSVIHAFFVAALFVISMMHMDRIHEFIYFQF
jgi:hypothetical protein